MPKPKTKNKGFIPYAKQWISSDDIQQAAEVLRGDWITQGPQIDKFEKAVAKYCGAKYAVAVSSGTAALHAAYATAGIGKGDELITTPLTFSATANAARYCGSRPVFVDIDPNTLNISPREIEKKITKKTKAIAPVDFAGLPCDYDEINKIAKKHNLLVIEDACHALGSTYKGKKIGSLSDMTIFSFHPAKAITTGEGGMVLTNNKRFYEKMRSFRHHGIVKKPEKGLWYYDIQSPGNNYRITSFQAALGLSQLKKLSGFLQRRREIVRQYNKAFGDIEEIITPPEPKGYRSAWHIYPVQFRLEKLKVNRKKLFSEFRSQGIGVQVHYIPVHLLSFYKKEFDYRVGDYPITENYYERAVTLPLFPKMTNAQVERVIKATKQIIKKYRK